ncbi:MAG: DNA alkylation repair protein [Candidatus Nanoarchaeia archaeon]|nr:DNA alkylation repair protein [Candidatus Nanoarchaeia archaeon]MDD5239732.1 DNA alkylation repair protein [Candidatus Nanoarchaeia archaeon]
MSGLNQLKKELQKEANPVQAKILQRFFKTGKGEYSEGTIFLGIKTPDVRETAKRYPELDLREIQKLLSTKIFDFKQIALIILTNKFKKVDEKEKTEIFGFYIKNAEKINSWGLVDISAYPIIGSYLLDKPRDILYQLAHSDNLWKKRIAMIATYAFIRNNQFDDTFKIAEILLKDKHNLIHKAVGWMLREAGKRNLELEEQFLKRYYKSMPRTMLRYAIERFPETKRKFYLKK